MIRFDTKKDLEYYDNLHRDIHKKDREIERLNNNWNELEKWIEKERDKWEKYNPDCFVYYQSILDRMEELKGVDKE